MVDLYGSRTAISTEVGELSVLGKPSYVCPVRNIGTRSVDRLSRKPYCNRSGELSSPGNPITIVQGWLTAAFVYPPKTPVIEHETLTSHQLLPLKPCLTKRIPNPSVSPLSALVSVGWFVPSPVVVKAYKSPSWSRPMKSRQYVPWIIPIKMHTPYL